MQKLTRAQIRWRRFKGCWPESEKKISIRSAYGISAGFFSWDDHHDSADVFGEVSEVVGSSSYGPDDGRDAG